MFISHKLDEIYQICDRVTVMRDGQFIVTKNCDEIDKDELIRLIVGRQLTELFPKAKAEIKDTVIEIKSLSRKGVFDDVSFHVRAGEILGVSGLMGSGRTEIMRAVFGIDHFDSGEIRVNGKSLNLRSSRRAIRSGLAMVTEDRLRLGSIHRLSVKENISIACLKSLCNRFRIVDSKRENKKCLEFHIK